MGFGALFFGFFFFRISFSTLNEDWLCLSFPFKRVNFPKTHMLFWKKYQDCLIVYSQPVQGVWKGGKFLPLLGMQPWRLSSIYIPTIALKSVNVEANTKLFPNSTHMLAFSQKQNSELMKLSNLFLPFYFKSMFTKLHWNGTRATQRVKWLHVLSILSSARLLLKLFTHLVQYR